MARTPDNKSSDICPFGPEMQRYWDKRYSYFSKFDHGIQTDAQGLHSVVPEAVAAMQAALIRGNSAVDAFAGIGGVSIALARAGKKVKSIEIDEERLKMAQHNAMLFGLDDAITFIKGDAFQLLPALKGDAVYLDPPWGGLMRRRSPPFLLTDFLVDGKALLTLALAHFREVVLKAPPNFALSEIAQFRVPFSVHDNNDLEEMRVISRTIVIRKES